MTCMRYAASVALLALLAACSAEPEPAVPDDGIAAPAVPADPVETPGPSASADPMTLTPAGLGPIVINSPPPTGVESALMEDQDQLSEDCRTLHSARYPGSYVMSDGKLVRRISIGSGSTIRTARGIGPGSGEADVRKAYSPLTEQPHKYAGAPAKYLTWRPDGDGPALRFEIDSLGRVAIVHAGVDPWLSYVEGCA